MANVNTRDELWVCLNNATICSVQWINKSAVLVSVFKNGWSKMLLFVEHTIFLLVVVLFCGSRVGIINKTIL